MNESQRLYDFKSKKKKRIETCKIYDLKYFENPFYYI